jgi:hypothetical protein
MPQTFDILRSTYIDNTSRAWYSCWWLVCVHLVALGVAKARKCEINIHNAQCVCIEMQKTLAGMFMKGCAQMIYAFDIFLFTFSESREVRRVANFLQPPTTSLGNLMRELSFSFPSFPSRAKERIRLTDTVSGAIRIDTPSPLAARVANSDRLLRPVKEQGLQVNHWSSLISIPTSRCSELRNTVTLRIV